jgi:hypothetical protein
VKSRQQKKYFFIVLLFSLLGLYNQCVPQATNKSKVKTNIEEPLNTNTTGSTGDNGGNGGNGNIDVKALSVQAFSTTTHNITKLRCATCHGSFQQPLHAVPDATQAHDAIVDQNKVDFNNIAQSRMVQKVRNDNHNCWSNCQADSIVIEDSIQDWKAERDRLIAEAGGTVTGDDGGNGGNPSYPNQTSESQVLGVEIANNNSDDGNIVMKAETAMLGTPMVSGNESGINFFWTPDQNGSLYQNNDSAAGTAYLNFAVSQSNQYKVYAKVNAPNGSDNSFHVRVTQNNFPVTNFFEWHIDVTNGFEWRELTHTSNTAEVAFFLAGNNTYTLEVKTREDGTKMSDIVMTGDPNFDPSTYSTAVKTTLTYDISQIVGVQGIKFKIDFEEYDMYSYKFSNPRIETTTVNVYVKNIKLIMNGNYNPQNATYTLVDTVATPLNGVLSSSALIALKDQGLDYDKVSFSFEILQVQ